MNYQDFADEIGVPRGTIKRWAHEGMPTSRMGSRVVVDVAPAYAWIAQRRPRALNRQGHVYFARNIMGNIKVGYSSDVSRRMVELQTSAIATTPGSIALEHAIHEMLKDSRIEGEWYRPTEEVNGLIELLQRMEAA